MGQIVAAGITSAANTAMQYDTNANNLEIANRTNETNRQISDAANRTQIQMWREQMAHDLDMWNRENQYNSPVEQQKRLEAAGINPLMIDAGVGNVSSSAGGQTPPTMNVPSMVAPSLQSPQFDASTADAFARAYKTMQEGRKAKSEAGIAGFEESAYREQALKGENPYLYKAKIMLEEYNKLKKENKYINPLAEKQLAKLGADIDLTKEFIKVRREELRKVVAETKGIEISNKFSEERFVKELAKLSEEIKSIKQGRINQTSVAEAQVNAANASANLATSQAALVDEQTQTQIQDTAIAQEKAAEAALRGCLARCGINPDASNLPFFASVSAAIQSGKVAPGQAAQFFKLLGKVQEQGVARIASSNANLSIMELFHGLENNPMSILNVLGNKIDSAISGQ